MHTLCQAMVTAPLLGLQIDKHMRLFLLDEIGWIAKMHSESLARKEKSDKSFADKMCEEVNLCEKWEDPAEKKMKMKDEDMVFW